MFINFKAFIANLLSTNKKRAKLEKTELMIKVTNLEKIVAAAVTVSFMLPIISNSGGGLKLNLIIAKEVTYQFTTTNKETIEPEATSEMASPGTHRDITEIKDKEINARCKESGGEGDPKIVSLYR